MAAERLAVVGAGWAGLAAAVRAVEQGWQVTLLDMARQPGGRARSVAIAGGDPAQSQRDPQMLDNGQHILIGAYRHTLALMRTVGVVPEDALLRTPLSLRYADGRGLQLPPGAPWHALARGVAATAGWTWGDKAGLLLTAGGWLLRGFRCAPGQTVASLCAGLPPVVLQDLIEPLCVAALNTPMAEASGQVFLTVLHDALFTGAGSADLLLPRQSLQALLPEPGLAWLARHGATCRLGRRVQQLAALGHGWAVDGECFDAVVLACTAREAARLTAEVAPAWSTRAGALRYQPIVTVWLRDDALHLPQTMLALHADGASPAQFVFDLRRLAVAPGLFAFVVSGATDALAAGLDGVAQAVLAQARAVFRGHFATPDALHHSTAERRATFACTPWLDRPPQAIGPGLLAAGDYTAGPYPATLEGAVRAGEAAVAMLHETTSGFAMQK